MRYDSNIFDYITSEETFYQTQGIPVIGNYVWSMSKHIELTQLYINSQYQNSQDEPFKNIIRPLLNLQHRAEGFDVKNIVLYADIKDNFAISFVVGKYHDKWAREEKLDNFIDNFVETWINFGGVLIKNGDKPKVVPWQNIAFCDQADIMSGAICEQFEYTPQEIKKEKNWENVDDLILLSEPEVDTAKGRKARSTDKKIKIYELHGEFPSWWLESDALPGDWNGYEYTGQVHIVAFYTDKKKQRHGITLYKAKEPNRDNVYKFFKRGTESESFGRALGPGGAEELFESQVWMNFDIIHMTKMLKNASKVLHYTDDPAFANRNRTLDEAEDGEIFVIEQGRTVGQINVTPIDLQAFDNSIKGWQAHGQLTAAAQDPILGNEPKSGTSGILQDIVVAQAQSTHDFRKGKLATYFEEIYMDWFLPMVSRKLRAGDEFLAELTLDEIKKVQEIVVTNSVNKKIVRRILSGGVIQDGEIEALKQLEMSEFNKFGNERWIPILKDEIKDIPLKIKVDIAGKQKNVGSILVKVLGVFQDVFRNPQLLENPQMQDLFNQVIESSGLSPIDWSNYEAPQMTNPAIVPQGGQPANAVESSQKVG